MSSSGVKQQEDPLPIIYNEEPIPIVHTLLHQYHNFFDSVKRPKIPKYETADLYLTLNDPELDAINTAAIREKRNLRKYLQSLRLGQGISKELIILVIRTAYNRTRRFLQRPTLATFVFLMVLGFISAFASVSIDIFLGRMTAARVRFSSLSDNYYINWLLWGAYGLFFAMLAACCVQYISPYIVGSGMPEMKTIISGIKMEKVLNLRTMIAKFFGIATTISAGFVVGRVGPFSHIVACMAQQLLKIRLFKRLRSNDFIRCNILSASCAAGVAATFGAPLGGVLFSVEITSTYYLVSNIWKGVLASLICSFFFYMSRQLGYVAYSGKSVSFALFPTNFAPFPYRAEEYFWFMLLGVIIGILGGLFISIFVMLIKIRNRTPFWAGARFWNVFLLCIIIAAVDFHFPLLKGTPGQTMSILFGMKPLEKHRLIPHLIFLIVMKYIFTMLSLTLPIPSGQVVQSFVLGAGAGRLYGEVLNLFLKHPVNAPGYAVLGAAAWAASTTRSFSMILIMLEMTGQLSYLVPCMTTVAFAIGTANLISDSIYDIMIKVRNLPYLTQPEAYTGQNIHAYNIMQPNVQALTTESTMAEIQQMLEAYDFNTFPIIDDYDNRLLLGEAHRIHIEHMLKQARNSVPATAQVATEASSRKMKRLEAVLGASTKPSDVVLEPSQELHNIVITDDPVARPDVGSDVSMVRPPDNNWDRSEDSEPSEKIANRIHHGASMRVVIHAAKYLAMNKLGQEQLLQIDPSPFCITELTTMNKIYYLFTMLGIGHAWVTSFGKLTGVLTKKQLIKVGRQMDSALGKSL